MHYLQSWSVCTCVEVEPVRHAKDQTAACINTEEFWEYFWEVFD